LAFLDGPPDYHTTCVNGITQEVKDPVTVVLPFLGVDGWWTIDVFLRSPKGFVTCPDACVRHVDEVSTCVSDSCVVNEDWHSSFRIGGVRIFDERVDGVRSSLRKGGYFLRGWLGWKDNARCKVGSFQGCNVGNFVCDVGSELAQEHICRRRAARTKDGPHGEYQPFSPDGGKADGKIRMI
jgi:hypothetical protein